MTNLVCRLLSINYKQTINALKTVGKRYDLNFLAILSSMCPDFYVSSSLFICGLGFLHRNLRIINYKEKCQGKFLKVAIKIQLK